MRLKKIAVIGLGYVGLPLALSFGKELPVIGFDTNQNRIDELSDNFDRNHEAERIDFNAAKLLSFTCDPSRLVANDFYIVTVPTPVDKENKPDLETLLEACKLVANHISEGAIIIIESTVYPGVTEEICAPLIEEVSGLKFNVDFFCGYSPERINPGDKEHVLEKIVKVTSGSTSEAAKQVDGLYSKIISAGTHPVSSIKIAEAAKVIENTQRDLNIALMNELSIIFNKLGINTLEVLEAAETKWNFLSFKPGLVGGHCIGVDPYYLTHLSEKVGVSPKVILAGRKVNDSMGDYVSKHLLSTLKKKNTDVVGANILILGLTFKENCGDFRNSQVFGIIDCLIKEGANVQVFDPHAKSLELLEQKKFIFHENIPAINDSDAIVLAVPHKVLLEMGYKVLKGLGKPNCTFFDLKGAFDKNLSDFTL